MRLDSSNLELTDLTILLSGIMRIEGVYDRINRSYENTICVGGTRLGYFAWLLNYSKTNSIRISKSSRRDLDPAKRSDLLRVISNVHRFHMSCLVFEKLLRDGLPSDWLEPRRAYVVRK